MGRSASRLIVSNKPMRSARRLAGQAPRPPTPMPNPRISPEAIPTFSGSISWALTVSTEKEVSIAETDPIAVLTKVGKWFERVGYVERTEFKMVGDGLLEYHMWNPLIITSGKRLIEEGSAAPHFSTTLGMAALKKKCGMGAEMLDDAHIDPDGHVWETWRLHKL